MWDWLLDSAHGGSEPWLMTDYVRAALIDGVMMGAAGGLASAFVVWLATHFLLTHFRDTTHGCAECGAGAHDNNLSAALERQRRQDVVE
jgi:NH3-dependent NAD+ synthetase